VEPLARLVAFYLPQFHPTPDNDEWWGPGFTEWSNVAAAQPLFRGHQQPRTPGELGFYDLRLPETRAAQAELAAAHGIEAFCYWHYWFHGRRMLDRPFAEVLASGEPDFPFCLAWANESWTRTWMGSGEVLVEQTYSAEDDRRHGRWLAQAFADPRYLRVDGRPVLLIYRFADLPNAGRTITIFSEEATAAGAGEPMFLGMNGISFGQDARPFGFDGTVCFAPQLGLLPGFGRRGSRPANLLRNLRQRLPNASLRLYDYRQHTHELRRRSERLDHPLHPTLLIGWDNTARRGRDAIVLLNDTADEVANRLRELIAEVGAKPPAERLIFVNAWNEWAEGNYLEPDLETGRAKLEAVRDVVMAGASDDAHPQGLRARP
jgi:lipopolysaccharide biosynthesis protein